MKKALVIIGAIVGLAIIALLAAPFLIPVETYKSELLAQVEKATGRKARIDGELSISLLPRVEFTAGKVSLGNVPGGKAPIMLSLGRLDVRVAVFPLLSGTVVIDSFVLEKPVINLEIDRQGRPNWVFAPAAGDGKPSASVDRQTTDEAGIGLAGLQLGEVRLVNGRIVYSDARTGTAYVVNDINMAVSLPSLTSPMTAGGSLVWNKEKIELKFGIENPDAFLKGTSTGLTFSVSSRPLNLDFKGEAASGKQIEASGRLDLDVPSVRKLAAWADQPLTAPGSGFGPLKIVGQVGVEGRNYRFTKAKLSLDKIEARGNFVYDGGGKRPYLKARLDTDLLDVNPYLPPEKKPESKAARPAPDTDGKSAPEGWSDEPIDLSGLRQADVDVVLKVAGLRVRKIKIGRSQVNVTLKSGRLVTELTEMALYNGNGKATLIADASSRTPAVSAIFDLSGLQANPALKDAIGLDRIEGTLNTNLKIATRGGSQRAMILALGGSGRIKFADGAIRGINLGAMARNVRSAFLDPKAREQQKTDFAELSGTFRITNGILRNDDLALLSPLLRVAGRGTVDLPRQTVNYHIEPKVAATMQGQGGRADVAGIMVPVIVSGPWNSLRYRPDLSGAIGGIAKDPSKALEGLKTLLPGTDKPGASPEGTGGGRTVPQPADMLKKLFGR